MRFRQGDRVQATRMGYGDDAGRTIVGTVAEDSYGPRNYIRVVWDDRTEAFGFADLFRGLRKIKKGRRPKTTKKSRRHPKGSRPSKAYRNPKARR